MDKSIWKVFKTLTITPIVTVLLMFIIEMLNASIMTSRIQKDVRTSLENACKSFVQESYNSTSLKDIKSSNGKVYVTGKVYGNENLHNKTSKYNYFFGYTNSYDSYYKFLTEKTAINDTKALSYYFDEVRYITKALKANKNRSTNIIDYETVTGQNLVKTRTTPINIGIPYVGTIEDGKKDRAANAVQRLFRWNLTQLESKCSKSLIKKDASDSNNSSHIAVENNGFRIYTDEAKITSIDYNIYDLNSETDRDELYDLIGIGETQYINSNMSNRYLIVAKIGYKVKIGYKGISRIGNIINFINKSNTYNYNASNIDSSKLDDSEQYIYFYQVM